MAIAEQVTGPNGEAFLREITAQSWKDDGRRAAALFAWIPRDAHSLNPDIATRAGRTAQAIASFIADSSEAAADAPANPPLWQSYSEGLIPYLGAMVGDSRNVSGFTPLDGLDTEMSRSAALFATVVKKSDGESGFTEAASARAYSYESEFAEAAVAEPLAADRGEVQEGLRQAARLRGLVAAGMHLADPEVPRRNLPFAAETEVRYQVAALTVQPDDPHISPEFFRDGRLMTPAEIDEDGWSIYDAQLTVYLTPWPRVAEAINQFGSTYATIGDRQ